MDTCEVWCNILKETPKAILIEQNGKQWWIPRSIVPSIRKDRKELPTNAVLQIEDWFLDKPENKDMESR